MWALARDNAGRDVADAKAQTDYFWTLRLEREDDMNRERLRRWARDYRAARGFGSDVLHRINPAQAEESNVVPFMAVPL